MIKLQRVKDILENQRVLLQIIRGSKMTKLEQAKESLEYALRRNHSDLEWMNNFKDKKIVQALDAINDFIKDEKKYKELLQDEIDQIILTLENKNLVKKVEEEIIKELNVIEVPRQDMQFGTLYGITNVSGAARSAIRIIENELNKIMEMFIKEEKNDALKR